MNTKRLIVVLGLCVLLLAACCARDTDNDGIIGNDNQTEDNMMDKPMDDSVTNGGSDNNMAGDVMEDVGNAAGDLADGMGNAAKDIGNGARNLTTNMMR